MSVIQTAIQHTELIVYLSGANNYSWLHYHSGDKKLLAKPLGYLEQLLPAFVRVHKTILINPAFVSDIQQPPRKKMSGTVLLTNGETFPVSRRRWLQVVASLQGDAVPVRSQPEVAPAVPPAPPPVAVPAEPSTDAVFLITDNRQDILSAEKIIASQWPSYALYVRQQSAVLPDLLQQLSPADYPALLLLDARTTEAERMNTLRRLKADHRFAAIPVILLVQPTDQLVISGYQARANSVIALPTDYPLFEDVFERVCQFWLKMAILPSAPLNPDDRLRRAELHGRQRNGFPPVGP